MSGETLRDRANRLTADSSTGLICQILRIYFLFCQTRSRGVAMVTVE